MSDPSERHRRHRSRDRCHRPGAIQPRRSPRPGPCCPGLRGPSRSCPRPIHPQRSAFPAPGSGPGGGGRLPIEEIRSAIQFVDSRRWFSRATPSSVPSCSSAGRGVQTRPPVLLPGSQERPAQLGTSESGPNCFQISDQGLCLADQDLPLIRSQDSGIQKGLDLVDEGAQEIDGYLD